MEVLCTVSEMAFFRPTTIVLAVIQLGLTLKLNNNPVIDSGRCVNGCLSLEKESPEGVLGSRMGISLPCRHRLHTKPGGGVG